MEKKNHCGIYKLLPQELKLLLRRIKYIDLILLCSVFLLSCSFFAHMQFLYRPCFAAWGHVICNRDRPSLHCWRTNLTQHWQLIMDSKTWTQAWAQSPQKLVQKYVWKSQKM